MCCDDLDVRLSLILRCREVAGHDIRSARGWPTGVRELGCWLALRFPRGKLLSRSRYGS